MVENTKVLDVNNNLLSVKKTSFYLFYTLYIFIFCKKKNNKIKLPVSISIPSNTRSLFINDNGLTGALPAWTDNLLQWYPTHHLSYIFTLTIPQHSGITSSGDVNPNCVTGCTAARKCCQSPNVASGCSTFAPTPAPVRRSIVVYVVTHCFVCVCFDSRLRLRQSQHPNQSVYYDYYYYYCYIF